MKKIFSTVTLICCFVFAKAQVNEYLVAADKFFAAGDYYSAAQYYEFYLGKKKSKNNQAAYNPYAVSAVSKSAPAKSKVPVSSKEQVIYNLAESYRHLNFHEKAEPYYVQAMASDRSKFPLLRYRYATTLRALGKPEEA